MLVPICVAGVVDGAMDIGVWLPDHGRMVVGVGAVLMGAGCCCVGCVGVYGSSHEGSCGVCRCGVHGVNAALCLGVSVLVGCVVAGREGTETAGGCIFSKIPFCRSFSLRFR
jgi:hypothetical protein